MAPESDPGRNVSPASAIEQLIQIDRRVLEAY